ncbi:MAG: hypothetical protein JSW26_08190 [Desulfobacterales bacterium]|nr:MAG: hypothetical protein JSW26_08190 [Desulfobacterales bacterium]
MKTLTKYKITRIIIFSLLLLIYSKTAFAQGGFDFYFFGQNIKSFQDSNWMKVAVGAFASICVHELGHAIYLESRGKSWNFNASISSGFSVHTDENLADPERSNFGRAGFALQSLVGTGLTLFEETRNLDFTKGWVAMNAVQVFSYQGRRNDDDDDFALIEEGGGDGDLEFAAFSFLSINNLMRLENDLLILDTKSEATLDFNLSNKFLGSEFETKEEFGSYPDSRLPLNITSSLESPQLDPQKAAVENSSWINPPKLADFN